MFMTDLRQFPRLTLRTVTSKLVLASAQAIIFLAAILAGASAQAQSYMTFAPGSGARPEAGVTIRGDFVYGTTASQGRSVVYEVKHSGTLYDFDGVQVGPIARVVFGPDGHLYGTFSDSNTSSFVFQLLPQATICKVANCQPWKVNVLYSFKGPPDGAEPGYGDLTWDLHGNIYGTTMIGGNREDGVVYELMPPVPPSNTWTENVIWSFSGPDGANPQSAVIFDGNGSLLGTAKQGGANGFGTVFKLIPSGNTWTETNIYDFQDGADGEYPIAGLMIDSSGNIYGATSDGGSSGGGTVFELTPSGNNYTFKLLYSFSAQLGSSCGPWATLTMDAAGSLYDTRYCGGANGGGSVFKLSNTQNGWVYTSFYDFHAFRGDLLWPISNVSFDSQGNLWGTASTDGSIGDGGVWEIIP
jgi:uncharacterized repeat protein (TIGR03803 family)